MWLLILLIKDLYWYIFCLFYISDTIYSACGCVYVQCWDVAAGMGWGFCTPIRVILSVYRHNVCTLHISCIYCVWGMWRACTQCASDSKSIDNTWISLIMKAIKKTVTTYWVYAEVVWFCTKSYTSWSIQTAFILNLEDVNISKSKLCVMMFSFLNIAHTYFPCRFKLIFQS